MTLITDILAANHHDTIYFPDDEIKQIQTANSNNRSVCVVNEHNIGLIYDTVTIREQHGKSIRRKLLTVKTDIPPSTAHLYTKVILGYGAFRLVGINIKIRFWTDPSQHRSDPNYIQDCQAALSKAMNNTTLTPTPFGGLQYWRRLYFLSDDHKIVFSLNESTSDHRWSNIESVVFTDQVLTQQFADIRNRTVDFTSLDMQDLDRNAINQVI